MKTNVKITRLFIGMGILLGSMISCMTQYRMTTIVLSDGSYSREIYTESDSVFVPDSKPENSCLFKIDSTTIQKHFRWFYTYYSYKTVYANISNKIPVPIHDYLNAAEQKMWFQGDYSAYSGMNGIELKDELDNIEKRFWKWYGRNVYEAQFEAITDYEKLSGGRYVSKLQEAKDTVFVILFKDFISIDSDPVNTIDIYKALDKHFNTAYYSGLYRNNQSPIDSLVKEKEAYLETMINKLFSNEIEYKLVMPGKTIYANAPVQHQDTLVWKVNAFRFISEDYVLTAESRTVHIWAFVVTCLLLALSVYCWRKIKLP